MSETSNANPMVAAMEKSFASVKAEVIKVLDQDGDGKITGNDFKIIAISAEAEVYNVLKEIWDRAEPLAVPLMTSAVYAAANSTGDKRKAALQGMEQGLIAIGKTAVADTAVDEATRIGQMVGMTGNSVDALRTSVVGLLNKNGLPATPAPAAS